jgi:hypothetical protein
LLRVHNSDALFAKVGRPRYVTARFGRPDPAVTDIFREVDEELRRESFEKLWRKYGAYAIALAVVIVLAVGAYVGWQRYTEHRQAERARQYVAAVSANGPEAVASLQGLATGSDGYAALALLHEAAAKAKAGDTAGAVATYEKLAADSSVDQPFRDLAVILLALATADTASPADLTTRLAPLTDAANPWHYSALEITALLARRAGDTARAQQIYSGLADDLNAPQALRARAAEMLAALRG